MVKDARTRAATSMSNPWLAWPPGTDPRALSRSLRIAHEEFLASGNAPSGVRALVADSWRRSLTSRKSHCRWFLYVR